MYLSNIGSVRELSTEGLLSQVLNLSIKLDAWKDGDTSFGILRATSGFGDWIPPSQEAENCAIALSLHYHRIVLLVHGAVVMRALECLSADGPSFSGITADMVKSVLGRDLVAAQDIHHVICEIVQNRPGFLKDNALWWICNYSGVCL